MMDVLSLRSSLSKGGLWVKDSALSVLENGMAVFEMAFIGYGLKQLLKHSYFALKYAGADLDAFWGGRAASYIATKAGEDVLLGDFNPDTICHKVQEMALGSEVIQTLQGVFAKARMALTLQGVFANEVEKEPLSLQPTKSLSQEGMELRENFIKNPPKKVSPEDSLGDQGFFSRAASALYDTLGLEGKRIYNSTCNGGIDPVEDELRKAVTWAIIVGLASLALYGVYSRSRLKEEKQDWKKQAQTLAEQAVLDKKIIEELHEILFKKETSSATSQDVKNDVDKKDKVSKRWNFLKKVSKIFRRSSTKNA